MRLPLSINAKAQGWPKTRQPCAMHRHSGMYPIVCLFHVLLPMQDNPPAQACPAGTLLPEEKAVGHKVIIYHDPDAPSPCQMIGKELPQLLSQCGHLRHFLQMLPAVELNFREPGALHCQQLHSRPTQAAAFCNLFPEGIPWKPQCQYSSQRLLYNMNTKGFHNQNPLCVVLSDGPDERHDR